MMNFTLLNFFSGGTMFHYYLKIVPTLYVLKHGETLETNQFSVTKYEKVRYN